MLITTKWLLKSSQIPFSKDGPQQKSLRPLFAQDVERHLPTTFLPPTADTTCGNAEGGQVFGWPNTTGVPVETEDLDGTLIEIVTDSCFWKFSFGAFCCRRSCCPVKSKGKRM